MMCCCWPPFQLAVAIISLHLLEAVRHHSARNGPPLLLLDSCGFEPRVASGLTAQRVRCAAAAARLSRMQWLCWQYTCALPIWWIVAKSEQCRCLTAHLQMA
ncbi:hypothetical protein BT67DRAFT_167403 [Trichocladium antarcticum]|uniref:Secreted protein n=1 Tax=Trichocladium antarcticum TaxID=1450529 RepID=A0AAN6ZB76_9PEZI|nr:hypothetical protein BT67DRAFT_167403 [Trichocladium antarcticum]